ncbi:DUF1643 domain-containing protein [Oscillatoria sp. FACHB-1407]|uniref:DUF1643 domain-containing protein n=1 Tax=Oscillatoria sp. FACHB-1407 TaxID=2692847 RepID=UPI00168590B4|nr:DUF1643 domain-containing protein [Oscillatoria sp. FACHB-1407]MBD2460605.1 DUF1643 domain-containing protein [Oscillatoria sp. FACHB-1407]
MGAIFDSTGTYRYTLWREWGNSPKVVFVMLNPSTADADRNDPTIRRCIGLAQMWGFGALEVVNLFAYCATHPTELRQATDPIGVENDRYLLQAVQRSDRTILAWGNWGSLHQRDRCVLDLLAQHTPLYCLGMNQSGQPRHPLYVKRNVALIPISVRV